MNVHPLRRPEPESLAQQQAMRYAEELRELYQEERNRTEELTAATEALERKTSELEVLHAIDRGILGLARPEATFTRAAEALTRLVAADRVSILVYDADRRALSELHSVGAGPPDEDASTPEGPLLEAIGRKRPVAALLIPPGDPRSAILAGAGLVSALYVPLVADGRVIGVLEVAARLPAVHTAEEIEVTTRIGAQIAVALRAAQLRRLEQRRTAELEGIRRVSEAVSASFDLDEVLVRAIECSTDAMGLEWGAVFLVDRRDHSLLMTACRGLPAGLHGLAERIEADESPLGSVLREGRARLLDVWWSNLPAAAAPLSWEGRVVGVMVLGSIDGREPGEEDLTVLTELCRPVAAAVEQAILFEDLKQADATRKMLLARLVEAQEEERRSIANDIHDDSVQVMTAVAMRLDLLRRQARDPKEQSGLEELRSTVRAAMDRLRGLMFELHPPTLDREGLCEALRLVLQRIETEHGLTHRLTSELSVEPSADVRAIVYRIAQEALSNTKKHAQAHGVRVTLEERAGGVLTVVRDDGTGFPVEEHPESPRGHLGLTAMRERAELAGGWLRIESAAGAGTSVEFWIPDREEA